MSRIHPTPHEFKQLMTMCRYCGADEGVWCTVPDGRWSGFLHGDRFHQANPDRPRLYAGLDCPRDAEAEIRLERALSRQMTTRPAHHHPAASTEESTK